MAVWVVVEVLGDVVIRFLMEPPSVFRKPKLEPRLPPFCGCGCGLCGPSSSFSFSLPSESSEELSEALGKGKGATFPLGDEKALSEDEGEDGPLP